MENITNIFSEYGLMISRMISGSKSGYLRNYPDNIVYFNANVIIDGKKVWHGDLDITNDKNKLYNISKNLEKELVILREMDARFENEDNPILDNYMVKFFPDGKIFVKELDDKIRFRVVELYINENITHSYCKSKL